MNRIKRMAIHSMLTLMILGGLSINHIAKGLENSTAIVLSPMSEKIILTPGEKYEGALKISNPKSSTSDLQYSALVESFSQTKDNGSNDDYGNIDTQTVTSYNQITKWIVLDKQTGTVAPNQTDILTYTINTPADAPAGGQYATIVITDESDHSVDGGNVNIASIPRVASIIYAEVTGETRDTGEIMENSIPSFLLDNTLEATSMVKNTGNVHTNASYVLQVWPMFGDEEICTNEEEPAESLVMPETEKFHAESCRLPSIGFFRAKQVVRIFGEESVVEKTIFVCPIWLIFVILFAIFALIFYFVAKAKARKKAAKSKSNQN